MRVFAWVLIISKNNLIWFKMFKILKQWILIPDKRNKYYVMKWSTRRGPLATFAECTKCGGKIHHWCKKIRSHLSCVAWSSLVTSATKDNLQDCHFDAPVSERFGTLLPAATDCISISSMPGGDSYDLQHQDSYTFQPGASTQGVVEAVASKLS